MTSKCQALLLHFWNDSIEFLDLENSKNDTNNVVLWLLQPEIEYMTLWRRAWRHHVTSKCYALIVQSLKWFRWISWPQKSRKWHQKRCSMIYTAKDRILDPLTSCVTSSRDVTVSSADRTVFEMIPLNFLTSKTYKITPKTLLYDFYSLVNKWGTLVPPVGLNRQIFYLGFSKVNIRNRYHTCM